MNQVEGELHDIESSWQHNYHRVVNASQQKICVEIPAIKFINIELFPKGAEPLLKPGLFEKHLVLVEEPKANGRGSNTPNLLVG